MDGRPLRISEAPPQWQRDLAVYGRRASYCEESIDLTRYCTGPRSSPGYRIRRQRDRHNEEEIEQLYTNATLARSNAAVVLRCRFINRRTMTRLLEKSPMMSRIAVMVATVPEKAYTPVGVGRVFTVAVS